MVSKLSKQKHLFGQFWRSEIFMEPNFYTHAPIFSAHTQCQLNSFYSMRALDSHTTHTHTNPIYSWPAALLSSQSNIIYSWLCVHLFTYTHKDEMCVCVWIKRVCALSLSLTFTPLRFVANAKYWPPSFRAHNFVCALFARQADWWWWWNAAGVSHTACRRRRITTLLTSYLFPLYFNSMAVG